MTDTALTTKSPPTPARTTQERHSWHALGHYAVGELSVGRSHNALCAYRLLNALEPLEPRWTLGRAFCALNLCSVAEAQKALDNLRSTPPDMHHRKLLHRCREKLSFLQREATTSSESPLAATSPIGSVGGSKSVSQTGKVIPFPNAQR